MSSETKQHVAFTVFGNPRQRGSKVAVPRPGGGTFMKDMAKGSAGWMKLVGQVAALEMGHSPLLTGPVMLTARFFFTRPASHYGTGRNAEKLKPSAPSHHAQSPDLAKLIRAIEDGMTGVVYRDDKQVAAYGDGTARYWTSEQARVEIEIQEL